MADPTGGAYYSPELAQRICTLLSEGASLRTITRMDGMPSMASVWKWIAEREEFQAMYATAKQESADALVEDMQAIADDPSLDPNDKRIRVDTRKWIASKLKPKRYGDKVQVSGDEDGAPLLVSWLGSGG